MSERKADPVLGRGFEVSELKAILFYGIPAGMKVTLSSWFTHLDFYIHGL